jgi:hypothetical protein
VNEATPAGGTQTILYVKQKFSTEKGPGGLNGRQLRRFVTAWNEQIAKFSGSMTRRAESMVEQAASDAWKAAQRRNFPKRYPPRSAGAAYRVVGHTPDATAGGPSAPPPAWQGDKLRAMALTDPVNSYIGAGVTKQIPMGTTYHRVALVQELP